MSTASTTTVEDPAFTGPAAVLRMDVPMPFYVLLGFGLALRLIEESCPR
jgi:hypothetical protein